MVSSKLLTTLFNYFFLDNIVMPEVLMETVELVMEGSSRIVEQARLPGENDVGMIAWRMTLYTPEYPEGTFPQILKNLL